jgi:hypothetical protein
MFDNRNDPDHLLASLEHFLLTWHNYAPGWYGIEPEKLAATLLPEPLRRLYAATGNWPGKNGLGSLFCYQDYLCPFELLKADDGRLVFAWENQGVWEASTLSEGQDPPVWIRLDEKSWKPLCGSLAQFLITLCLHETVLGCDHLASGENLLARMIGEGKHVAPLWLDGPYADMRNESPLGRRSFHVVDRRILIMDDHWCGTNSAEEALRFPHLFKAPLPPDPDFQVGKPLWEIPSLPLTVKKVHLESLAAKHDAEMRHHAAQASTYRRIAESLKE